MDKIVGRRFRSRRRSIVDEAPVLRSGNGANAPARLLHALDGGLTPGVEQDSGLCLEAVFKLLRHSVLVVDAGMNIVWLNDAARELLTAGDILSRFSNRLCATDSTESVRLRQFVSDAISVQPRHDGQPVMSLRCVRTGRYVELVATRSLWSGAGGKATMADPVAVVLVSDPQQSTAVPDSVLTSLFGLTACERRLAKALLNGESLDSFSETAHVSINTARSHLKAVFRKTGTSSQPALVTLLSRLVPPVKIDDESS